MLVEGLQVMLVGLGAVFAFLSLLVAVLWATGKAVLLWERWRPDGGAVSGEDREMAAVAAVVAAVLAQQRKERQ